MDYPRAARYISPQSRLTKGPLMQSLEEQIAHLQKMTDDMSDMMARQDQEISRLRQQVDALIRREAEREAEMPGSVVLGNERPPHY